MMNLRSLTRRDLATAASAAATAAMLPFSARGAATLWPIGSHTRPFGTLRLSQDAMLDAIKAAGYQSADFIGVGGGRNAAPATPDSVAALKEKLAARGLKTNVGNLMLRTGVPPADAIAAARQQITDAHALGQTFMLSLGITQEKLFVDYCKVMSDAAAFGQERGVKVVIKCHGGLQTWTGELLGFVAQINHPNFGIFFDPGNVIYYTGKDPLLQLEMIAPRVVGVIAKDCTDPQFKLCKAGDPVFGAGPPNPGGNEVMIQLGTGKVDFLGVFRKLKTGGFNGPIVVEGGAAGATVQATTDNARANREFLEKVIAQV
jgi:sugar phosphate isomerase/epimerase